MQFISECLPFVETLLHPLIDRLILNHQRRTINRHPVNSAFSDSTGFLTEHIWKVLDLTYTHYTHSIFLVHTHTRIDQHTLLRVTHTLSI